MEKERASKIKRERRKKERKININHQIYKTVATVPPAVKLRNTETEWCPCENLTTSDPGKQPATIKAMETQDNANKYDLSEENLSQEKNTGLSPVKNKC